MANSGFMLVQHGETVSSITRPAPVYRPSGQRAWSSLWTGSPATCAAQNADTVSQKARFMMHRSNGARPDGSVDTPDGSARLAFTLPG